MVAYPQEKLLSLAIEGHLSTVA